MSDVVAFMASNAIDRTNVSATNPLPVSISSSGAADVVYNTTAPSLTNGQTTQFQADASGRLLTTERMDVGTVVTGALTGAAAVTATGIASYQGVIVAINGTYGISTGAFQVSDDNGTTWYNAQGARSDSPVVEGGFTSVAANTSRLWYVPTSSATQFRVNVTTMPSGTLNVRITPTTAPIVDSSIMALAAGTGGGIPTTARLASAANSTNATNIKAAAGTVFSIQGKNAAAYDVFLVLYDSAASPPVPGSTTIRKKVPLPAGGSFVLEWGDVGLGFSTGIGYAFTKLVADADTTVIAAADIIAFNVDYY